jgi:hypothetical protein
MEHPTPHHRVKDHNQIIIQIQSTDFKINLLSKVHFPNINLLLKDINVQDQLKIQFTKLLAIKCLKLK